MTEYRLFAFTTCFILQMADTKRWPEENSNGVFFLQAQQEEAGPGSLIPALPPAASEGTEL